MTADAFLKELQRLIYLFPRLPTKVGNSENCDYANEVYYSKNLTYAFDTVKSTDSVYLYDAIICDKCTDCDYPVESQLCYESVDLFQGYNCDYSNYCARIQDSSYCNWCWDSHDLFGCVNLINKSFCIFNRQLTENEYKEQVKKYKAWPPEKVLAVVEQLKLKFPLTQTIGLYNENSNYGNYQHYCKNCYLCFDVAHDNNSAYLYDTFNVDRCFDMTYCGIKADLSYEVVSAANIFNSNYILWSEKCVDSSYIFQSNNVKNSLGCVGLAHKQYCILNRQFSKEDYERISSEILNQLKTTNVGWGNLTF